MGCDPEGCVVRKSLDGLVYALYRIHSVSFYTAQRTTVEEVECLRAPVTRRTD